MPTIVCAGMDLARLGILACPSTILLASVARAQRWIGDGAQLPLVLLAVGVGTASFFVFQSRRNTVSVGGPGDPSVPIDPLAVPCPTCGYDVRHMPERCPECGALVPPQRRPLDPRKLRDDWPLAPLEPRKPGVHEPLVHVWNAPHAMAANLLVEQFRARGVQAVVRRNVPAMRVGEYVTPGADHAVHVFAGDADLAHAILMQLAVVPT